MAVEVQRFVDAAFQRVVHDEVETAEPGQLVAYHRAGEECAECALQPLGGGEMRAAGESGVTERLPGRKPMASAGAVWYNPILPPQVESER